MDDRWSPGLYLPDVVAHRDGDRFVVVGSPMGPAGASSVELPDGSTWQVDHARPEVLVGLEVDGTDPAGTPLLVTAFGGDGALFVVDPDTPVPSSEGRSTRRVAPRSNRRVPVSRPQSPPPRDVLAAEAGRRVVLVDLSSDPRLHPLARLAASVELVLTQGFDRSGGVLDLVQPQVRRSVGELADDVDDLDVERLTPEAAAALADLLRSGLKAAEGSEGRWALRRLRDLATRRARPAAWDTADRAVAGRPPSAMAAAPAPDLELLHLRAPEGAEPEVHRLADGLLRVTVDGPASDRWVRVFRRDGLVLLGQSPLRDEPPDRRSAGEVAVPPDAPTGDLLVQVAAGVELTSPALRPAELVRAAVRAGRDAARASRLGELTLAAARWHQCAGLWERAGDLERAYLAQDWSRWSSGPSRVGPSVADQVTEALSPVV